MPDRKYIVQAVLLASGSHYWDIIVSGLTSEC